MNLQSIVMVVVIRFTKSGTRTISSGHSCEYSRFLLDSYLRLLSSGKLIPREPAARDNCKSEVYYLPKHQGRRHQMGEFQEESFTISETEIELLR